MQAIYVYPQLTFWFATFNFQEHQSLCEYALIPCHTGCGHVVMRKNLADHLEDGCVNNVTVCQKCKRSLSSSEYQVRFNIVSNNGFI